MSEEHEAEQSIRFLADENFRRVLVEALRQKQPEVDIMTAREAGILHFEDPLVLAFAAEQGRVLLTHDKRTMPDHLAAFLTEGKQSPGILYLPQDIAIGQAIADLLLIWEASGPEDWQNLFSRLPL